MKWLTTILTVLLLLTVFPLAGILGRGALAYADEPTGESNIVIDICVTGTTQVHVTATDGTHIDVGAQGTADAHMHFAADADTVFDIYITGDGEADIDVSGPCEVNVRVEGPTQVHIDAGDEVKLDVEASDESQVFIDDEKLDEPLKSDDQESGDIDEHSSRLDDLAIISGAFLVAGVPCFFLIRRKRKREEVRK